MARLWRIASVKYKWPDVLPSGTGNTVRFPSRSICYKMPLIRQLNTSLWLPCNFVLCVLAQIATKDSAGSSHLSNTKNDFDSNFFFLI